jgi:hypothetical protein
MNRRRKKKTDRIKASGEQRADADGVPRRQLDRRGRAPVIVRLGLLFSNTFYAFWR